MGHAGRTPVLESLRWADVAKRVVTHLDHSQLESDAVTHNARE